MFRDLLSYRFSSGKTWSLTGTHSKYSAGDLRFWGMLIGMGFSLGIASAFLIAFGNQPFEWSFPMILGFGLGAASLIGLWLELRKPKR